MGKLLYSYLALIHSKMTSCQAATKDAETFWIPIALTITSIARILDKSDRRDRCIYSRDLERDLNSHVSLPRPLSDFDPIVRWKIIDFTRRIDGCGDYLNVTSSSSE